MGAIKLDAYHVIDNKRRLCAILLDIVRNEVLYLHHSFRNAQAKPDKIKLEIWAILSFCSTEIVTKLAQFRQALLNGAIPRL